MLILFQKINKQIDTSHTKTELSELHLNLVQRILDKYPEFDPNWDIEVQSKWMDGMTKLYDNLSSSISSGE